MRNNTNRVGGTVINWITIFIQIVISIFFVPFFLKVVGDKEYGVYSFSTSLIAWLDTLMVAVAAAYYKFLTREKKKYGDYGEARACGVFAKIFIAISIIVLLVGILFDLLLFNGVIPLNEYSSTEKNQICIIILMSLLSTTVSCSLTAYKSYHFYKQKFVLIYSFSLAQIIAQTVLSVIFLKNGFGVVAVAAAHFGTALTSTILLSVLSRVFLKEKVVLKSLSNEDKLYRRTLLKEMLVFSIFIVMNTVVDTLNKTLDKTILGFYNADSVATYQLAYTFPAYLIAFTSIVSIVFDQKLNDAYYNGGGVSEMNEIFLKVSKIQTIVCFLIVGGFVACGKEFIFLWLDNTRLQVYIISCIMMVTYSITCSNRLAIMARRVQNKHIKASLIYLGIAAFNVALSLALVNIFPREYAIWSCLTGSVVTYLIGHWIIMQIYDQKIANLSVNKFFFVFIKYLFIAAIVDVVVIRFGELFEINHYIAAFFVKGAAFLLIYLFVVCFAEKELFAQFKYFCKNVFRKRKK